MPPRRVARSVSRRNSPQSPPKPQASVSSPSLASQIPSKQPSRSHSREPVGLGNPHQHQSNAQSLSPLGEAAENPNVTSPSRLSTPSSSDQFESLSQDFQADLDELDRDTVIDDLRDLYHDSSALLAVFSTPTGQSLSTVIAQVSQPTSLLGRRFRHQARNLQRTRQSFGENDLINPSLIVCKVAGATDLSQVEDALWRPDAILHLANLSLQLIALFMTSPEDRKHLSFMYNNFPNHFAGPLGSSFALKPSRNTFELVLDVTTQLFLHTATENNSRPDFDPHQHLQDVFWDDPDRLLGDYDTDTESIALARFKVLQEHLNSDLDLATQLQTLSLRFPWSEFLRRVLQWSIERASELNGIIASQSGVDKIVDSLIKGDHDSSTAPSEAVHDPSPSNHDSPSPQPNIHSQTASAKENQLAHTSPTPNLTTEERMHMEFQQLRKEKARHAAQVLRLSQRVTPRAPAPDPLREIPQSPTPVADILDPHDDDANPNDQLLGAQTDDDIGHDDDLSALPAKNPSQPDIIPTQNTAIIMQTLARQAAEREKENGPRPPKRSLLDRQATAIRDEWTADPDFDSIPMPEPRRRATKRPSPVHNDESGEEEGFEEDSRPHKKTHTATGRQSALKSMPLQQAYLKDKIRNARADTAYHRAEPASHIQPAVPSLTQPNPQYPQSASVFHDPPSTAPPGITRPSVFPTAAAPQATQAHLANLEAKVLTAQARERHHPKTQTRIPWTVYETDRLIEMVGHLRTQWSAILKRDMVHEDGPQLQKRTQVGLKDKARNIKIDFLKARRALPPGFEDVSLSVRDKEHLTDMGVYVPDSRYTGPNLE